MSYGRSERAPLLLSAPHAPDIEHQRPVAGIIGAGIEVHRELGPKLLESTYSRCLQRELTARNLHFERERVVPLTYKGEDLDACYRIDLIVEGLVVVELKSIEHVLPVHKYQVLTYLRVTECPLGLLINFSVAKLIDGVTRLVNPRRRAFIGDSINIRDESPAGMTPKE